MLDNDIELKLNSRKTDCTVQKIAVIGMAILRFAKKSMAYVLILLHVIFFTCGYFGFAGVSYAAEKKVKNTAGLRPVEIFPDREAGLIPVDSVFKVRFNQELDPNAIDEKNVAVQVPGGKSVEFKLNYDKKSKTLIIRPNELLAHETDYRIILKSGLMSKSGKKLGTSFSYQFSTAVSPLKPPVKVVSVKPAAGSEVCDELPIIYAQFDQNLMLKDGEELEEYVSLFTGNEKWPCAVSYSRETKRLEIKPQVCLPGGKNYRVIISRKIRGTSGKLMAETYIWEFRTAEILFFVKYSYPNSKVKAINSYDRLLFTFSESVNSSSEFENYITIRDEKNNAVPGQFYVFNLHNLIFIPDFYFYKGNYKVTISKDFESFNSNRLMKDYEVAFTVKSDDFNSGDLNEKK